MSIFIFNFGNGNSSRKKLINKSLLWFINKEETKWVEMNEAFPWVEVLSAFLWILGLAIILTDFSYHEFLVHKKRLKWGEVIRSRGFLWPIKLAIVMIFFGLAGSIPSPFWGGIFGAAGFLTAVLFLKGEEKINRWVRHKIRKLIR